MQKANLRRRSADLIQRHSGATEVVPFPICATSAIFPQPARRRGRLAPRHDFGQGTEGHGKDLRPGFEPHSPLKPLHQLGCFD